MPEKVHWKKVVSDPNYLGEADFAPGEEKILTIGSVNQSETVVTAEGKSQKAVIHWKEPGNKAMILNVARSKAIAKVAKSDYLDDWVGVKVQLYIEHGIKAFGDTVSAVRVRPFPPRISEIKCQKCGKIIKPANGMSAEQLAAYSKKKLGRELCMDCAIDLAANGKKSEGEAKNETAEAD